MKLKVNNFAKIKEADIIIDGITVIAGENNTGKSTIGKILFSLFNSLSNVDLKVTEERIKETALTNRSIIQNKLSDSELSRNVINRITLEITKIINNVIWEQIRNSGEYFDSSFYQKIKKVMESKFEIVKEKRDSWDEIIEYICKNMKEVFDIPEEKIILEIVSRYFNEVFHFQIESLSANEEDETSLILEIKDKKDRLVFKDNNCIKLEDNIKLIHNAIYIDNPFVIDDMGYYVSNRNTMSDFLVELLTDTMEDGFMDGLVGTVRAKEKFNDIYESLNNVVNGEIGFNSMNNEYYLKSNDFNKPISLTNLSTGMKSFVILKILLEKGCIREKDVIILDEPEIHLHPQWQIIYAELIVLIQKYFDLSVVITTHSPYFVDAINLFSCKHGTDSKVNYYLSDNVDNEVTMECVTEHIDLIYQKMASPIQELENLRYELNNN